MTALQGSPRLPFTSRSFFRLLRLTINDILIANTTPDQGMDDCNSHLTRFFTIFDYIFMDGGYTSSLFVKRGPFDAITACLAAANAHQSTVDTVNELNNIRTSLGKARAWLRICLMHRILSECISTILGSSSIVLSQFYTHDSLIRSDEAQALPGLLLTCDQIALNFDLKTNDFSYALKPLDFGYYLKNNVWKRNGRQRRKLEGRHSFGDELNRLFGPTANDTLPLHLFSSPPVNGDLSVSAQTFPDPGKVDDNCRSFVSSENEQSSDTGRTDISSVHANITSENSELMAVLVDLEKRSQSLNRHFSNLAALSKEQSNLLQQVRAHNLNGDYEKKITNKTNNCLMNEECDSCYTSVIERSGTSCISQESFRLQEENVDLSRTLAEMASKLERSTIEKESILEELMYLKHSAKDRQITPVAPSHPALNQQEHVQCHGCGCHFHMGRRRHLCGQCQLSFCHNCSSNRLRLTNHARDQRLCDRCYSTEMCRPNRSTAKDQRMS